MRQITVLWVVLHLFHFARPALSQPDTDDDGLLDLIDVAEFNPNAQGVAIFTDLGIQDLDGVAQLVNVFGLRFENNPITSVESGDFVSLPKLLSLSISNSLITTIDPGDFSGLQNLESLGLSGNLIAAIEPGSFEGLTNLRTLFLTLGQITEFSSEDLRGLPNLERLALTANRITSIQTGNFRGLNNLRNLSLDSNQIASVERDDFIGLDQLESLRIANNQIASIEADDFSRLSALETLALNHNSITAVEPGAFDNLSELTFLSLAKNDIVSLERNLFVRLPRLINLGLSHNHLSSVSAIDLSHQAQLETLNLAGNEIATIEHGDFVGLESLQKLWIDDNRLVSIEDRSFAGLPNLHSLWLQDNEHLEELNLTGAVLEQLRACDERTLSGFCVDDDIGKKLRLDESSVSQASFDAITGEATSITDVSIVGLSVPENIPFSIASLLAIPSLDNVTVDQQQFDRFAEVLLEFDAIEGNNVLVVPGLCDVNRDGQCNVDDINELFENIVSERAQLGKIKDLIESPYPLGFNTYIGDANLDGEFSSRDFVQVFAGGEYEDLVRKNSIWETGDWNGDGEFDSSDFVVAFESGGYESGPRNATQSVPESKSTTLTLLITLAVAFSARRPGCVLHDHSSGHAVAVETV